MSDLTDLQSATNQKISGADASGVETYFVGATPSGNIKAADVLDVSYTSAAMSVSTSAVEAKVGGSRLANRKMLSITPTNGTVYRGSSNAVTTSTGTPIFKNQSVTISFTDNVAVWLIAGSAIDVRIEEAS